MAKKVEAIKSYTDHQIQDLADSVWSKLDPLPETKGISPLFEMISLYPIRVVEINGLTFQSAADFLTAETGQIIPVPQNFNQSLAGFLFIQRYRKTFYGCILVEQRDFIVRRRFSAAHEFGHYLLHFLPLLESQSSDNDLILIEGLSYSKDSVEELPAGKLAIIESPNNNIVFSFIDDAIIEREANRFAAELLIPEDACKSIYQSFSLKYGKKHLVLAKRLATEFLVSLEAMKWRLVALNLFDN
jgi:Zn-dependent peptidase ImmA (M78 family)